MDRDNKLIMEALNSKFTKPVDVSDSIKTQLGQAHGIIKGLIELLDRTPSGQTPYNEMAITHLVNLQEDLKELSQILQDRMLNKSENAEAASAGKKRLKYDYEWVTAFLPRDIDISNRAGEEKVLDLAFKETLRLLVPDRKNPLLAARNMFGDEDFPGEIVSQYAHYQQHGFPDASADGWYAAKDEDAESEDERKERVQRGWDINKKRWAKWKAENPEAAAKHAAKKAAGKEENAEHEPHGYPQGMTAIQNLLLNELKKRGFELTKISHVDKERDKYPTVFMMRSKGPMHNVVEIDGMGAINGEHYKDYMANLNDGSEDAEHRSNAQNAAIAISLQKAGKKPS